MIEGVIFLIFCATVIVGNLLFPVVYKRVTLFNEKRTQRLTTKMERVIPRQSVQKVTQLYLIAPVALAVAGYIVSPEKLRLFGVLLGIIGGFIFPSVYTHLLISRTRNKFNDQLMDALMIMSSSFRGGLSLVQAMEEVVAEMPNPINQEFSLVLGENKMGVTLDEALNHLYARMPSPAVQQMITAILLARETGGNLPVIFNRIIQSIRSVKEIRQNLATLTLQGKIQGMIMTGLPFLFVSIAYSTNPHFFDQMFETDLGRTLIIYAAISWVIGAFMIIKISSMKDF